MPAIAQGVVIGATIAIVVPLTLGAVLLGATFAQARILLRPVRTPLALRPSDVDLPVEDVRIPSPRGRLAAWYVPARNGCMLICCHGINDNRGQWLRQVARLHRERGYGAVLFDFAGHGDSEGNLVTYGAREVEDVHAVLAYLRERGDVDMRGVGIMGYSLGAITAILAAAQEPDLHAVVVESGFSDLHRDIAVLFHRFTGMPAFPFANLVVFWGQRISGIKLGSIRPERVIGQIAPRAVFIISDLKDAIADEPRDGEHLYANAQEPKQFWQVPDVEHVQAFNVLPDEWIARVEAFLDQYLAAPLAAASVADTMQAGHGDETS